MIAKRIPREKGTSSVSRLVRYMVAAVGEIDPNTWSRTSDYILDTKEKTIKGEKVASYRVTNCETDDPAAAAILIEATQAANTRSKADKTYHLVFSFPPGENPSIEVLHAIEDELCAAIGYADHHRISAVHNDTDHLHVHVAINKVHPTGLQNIEPYFDKKRLMETCSKLEVKYDLERTNHGLSKDKESEISNSVSLASEQRPEQRLTLFRKYLSEAYNLEVTELPEAKTKGELRKLSDYDASDKKTLHKHEIKDSENDRLDSIRLEPGQRPEQRSSGLREYLRKSYDLALTEPPEAKTLNSLRKLSGGRLDDAEGTAPMLLPGDPYDDLQQGGKNLSDSVRRTGNGHRADDGQNGRPRGIAADIEAESGVETLTGYVAREVAPSMRKASSWQEVHAAAAEHGLEVRARGAGLVIGDAGLPLWTKASSCGRDLSLKALTDRLGPFEKNTQQQARKDGKGYSPKPRQAAPSSAALFAQYQRERQANIVKRRAGLEQIRQESSAFGGQVKSWAKTQRAILKAASKGTTRAIMSQTIKQQAQASRAANRVASSKNRQKLFEETSTPAWADWLAKQAEKGNAEALEVLRSQEQRARRWQGDLLTAAKADKAKAVVLDRLNPKARKDGTMAYSTVDGGMVIDRNTHVHAQKATTGAALVALEISSKRFEGQPLIVEGTAAFRDEVARLAGFHKLAVTFADPAMEEMRQQMAGQRTEDDLNKVGMFDTLVEHGAAPYEHKKGARPSYFVTLIGDTGEEKTIWGVDLKRAVTDSGARVGDLVSVEHVDAQPVTLPTGENVLRNGWNITKAPKDQAESDHRPASGSSPADAPTPEVPAKPKAKPAEQPKPETAAEQKPQPLSPADLPTDQPSEAVANWINKRNGQRDKISSIDYHRIWDANDAGKAIYQGRRKMEDDSEVLLLKKGDELLVKPAGPRVVAKASKWKLGQIVQLDSRGRFKEQNNGVEL
jgi:Fe-S cluster biosynthesis and repair protein YggX